MAFPLTSNFQSGNPLDAWFTVQKSGSRDYGIATQGETAIKRIQQALNLEGITARPSSSALRAGPIDVDGAWGYQTGEGLLRVAERWNAQNPGQGYGVIVERLRGDLNNRTISNLGMRVGLWLAYVSRSAEFGGVGYEAVSLPSGVILPRWGQAPDDDRGAGGDELGYVGWLVGVQAPPVAPARAAERGTSGASGVTGSQNAQAALVVPRDRGAAGGAAGGGSAGGMLQGTTAGVSNGWLAAIAAIGAGVVLYYALNNKKTRYKYRARKTLVLL